MRTDGVGFLAQTADSQASLRISVGLAAWALFWLAISGSCPPIGDAALIAPAKGQSRFAAGGQERFRDFTEIVRLRRVYRQAGASAFKDSTLRLRDGAMTLADHELWRSHDLSDGLRAPVGAAAEIRKSLEENALWLVTENGLAGARNGEKLVQLATDKDAPEPRR